MKAIVSIPALLITVVWVVFVVILAFNLARGEQSVEGLSGTADPAFARAMGVLLEPAILQGNRFEVLLNGDPAPSYRNAIDLTWSRCELVA